jgi:2-haloacid dehalogenase
MAIRAVVFDAYGTLFDVHSIGSTAERFFPGQGSLLSRLWRERQIEYTRLRTLSGRYLPFSRVTADALRFTLKKMQLDDPEQRAEEALLLAYRQLAIFPENKAALEALAAQRLPLAILSNGDAEMLGAVVRHAGVEHFFEHILSCDQVRRFKTAPETYGLVTDTFACAPRDILFVSSNCWDACGASWFGNRTFWINRAGEPPEELDATLDGSAPSMTSLPDFVAGIAA